MQKFSRFVLKYSKLVLAAGILLTVVLAYYAQRLHIDNSVRAAFPSHNKDFQQLEKFLEQFGGDELIVLAYRSDDIFSKKHLSAIDRISRQIAQLEDVLRVTSLTTVSDFRASQGRLRVVDFIERNSEGGLALPESAEGMAGLRNRILGNSLYVENIISADGKAAAVAAHIVNKPGDDAYKRRLVRQIKEIAASSSLNERFYFAGPPVFSTEMERYVSRDLKVFTPLVMLMIGLLLFYVFRSWRAVVLPLATVLMCVLWTAGVMQLTVGRITIGSTILPPLIIAIGVAIVVHVFAQYQDELHVQTDRRPALQEAITHVGWPCLLTAVTTALGFASLTVSEVPTIIETGLFAAFGAMVAFLIAMTFVPSVLLYSKVEQRPVEKVHPFLVRGLRGIGRINEKRPRLIILIALLLVGLSVLGISQLEVETNLINYFSPETEVRKAQDFVSKHLGGSITMDVVIRAAEGGTVANLETLKKVDRLEKYLRTFPAVGKIFSVAGVVKVMNKELMGEESLLEEMSFLTEQHLQFVRRARSETGLFAHLVDENLTTLRVTARLHQLPSKDLLRIVNEVENYLSGHLTGEYEAELTGSTRLFARMGRILVEGEIKGLIMAIISIFVVITLLFRNLWVGLITIVPNALPIMITAAVMGFLKIPINVTTAMIPCIALGIAVDDAIHYVSRFKREFAQDQNYVNAMFRTLQTTGKPIVFTSAILFCGFITLIFSSFSANMYFGLLTSLTMVSALLGDLLILPVLMNTFRPIRVKKDKA